MKIGDKVRIKSVDDGIAPGGVAVDPVGPPSWIGVIGIIRRNEFGRPGWILFAKHPAWEEPQESGPWYERHLELVE